MFYKKLLITAFGEAGQRIVNSYIDRDELRILAEGTRVSAVFGFCDMRNFTELTELLNERVMLLVNNLADVIHGITVQCGGM